jgi:dTDP-4-amino-4,6-dideoxygalactose transaminase
VRAHLTARGIGTEIYYPLPLHRQACFRSSASPACPVADAAAADVLALPIFPELTAAQQRLVVEAIAEVVR